MKSVFGSVQIVPNPGASSAATFPVPMRKIIDPLETQAIRDQISHWPGYSVTPLHKLDGLAREICLDRLWYKDESQRFGLKSFKALGGAYAIAKQVRARVLQETGLEASEMDLLSAKYHSITQQMVMTCATDGNHGRSVAWGCQLFGCRCVIYIHRDVSSGRASAMQQLGAEIVRIDGNYDDAVRQAAGDAVIHGRLVISDTSYPGYVDIPRDVIMGYTVMLAEIAEQLAGEVPTHVFVQAGVGGLAASVCGFFWDLWQEKRPRFVVVEPEQANCLQMSARRGKPTVVTGSLETMMAGLACGEVSLAAWEVLGAGVNDFLTVSETSVPETMRLLAQGFGGDPSIEAGESAVAGLGALITVRNSQKQALQLGLDSNSRVLILGTEGATDPALYKKLISRVPL